MILEKSLTKEHFFDEMMEKFPKAMKKFCSWIDEYKKAVNWNDLFGNNQIAQRKHYWADIKFHHLPYDMQYGIWIAYCRDTLGNFFEQPEHISDFVDLEEDIKTCFAELEPLIDDED